MPRDCDFNIIKNFIKGTEEFSKGFRKNVFIKFHLELHHTYTQGATALGEPWPP